MSIKLYYAPGACSLASHIVLEEVGIPYETQRLNTAAGEQRSPEYLKINPRGRVPALVVDGQVLTENMAIISYLGGGYPKAGLWPEKTWDQAKLLSMMAWFSNTVHPAYGHYFRAERYADDEAAQQSVKAKGRTMFEDYLKEIDRMLEGRKWLVANQYTVADPYALVFYRWGNRAKLDVRSLENYTALVERVLARPAVKKVMADEGITLD
ncbi:MAG: glutathione S-transferase family protein [Betaproteobacteria bacterium]